MQIKSSESQVIQRQRSRAASGWVRGHAGGAVAAGGEP